MDGTPRIAGLALTLGLSIFASGAAASEIYRYTDEDGNIHFTDRPTGQSDVERVAIVSRPTDDAAVQQRYEARFGESDEPDVEVEVAQEDQDENGPRTRNDHLVEAEQRARACAEHRARLEMLDAARRLYREDASTGERTYLDDDQIEEARARERQLVADTCD